MSRAKYCRGFGIQSPWAYRFVRYVVNEHYPYYAYDDLRPLFPHLSKRERRVCELYLRIANHLPSCGLPPDGVFFDGGGGLLTF